MCSVKKREQKRAWALANPARVAASRSKPGQHQVLEGVCAVCGPVPLVPWGRGYACSVRAGELRKVQQERPAERCRDCKVWFTAERCPKCLTLVPHRTLEDLMTTEIPQWDSTVDLLIRRDLSEPRDDGRDRTNPALKTLGDRDVPAQWRWALQPNPDWSRLDSM